MFATRSNRHRIDPFYRSVSALRTFHPEGWKTVAGVERKRNPENRRNPHGTAVGCNVMITIDRLDCL